MQPSSGLFRRRLPGLVVLLGVVGAALVGCGQGAGTGEKLVPVAGKVQLGDKPLGTGSVTFHADAAKGNKTPHIPVGFLDAQGNYKLTSAKSDGAPPGWYKVTVVAHEPADEKNPYAPPKHMIHTKFGDAQTSGFAVEVVEKPAPGAYDFTVTK